MKLIDIIYFEIFEPREEAAYQKQKPCTIRPVAATTTMVGISCFHSLTAWLGSRAAGK